MYHRSTFFVRAIILSFLFLIQTGCVLKKCEVLTVLDKTKMYF